MKNSPVRITFNNRFNPDMAFDLIRLETLLQRDSLSHDPTKLHKVDFFILLFITQGKGYHTIDFTDHPYEKGSLLTIRKNQIHKFSKATGVKGYLLLFTDEFLISYLEKLEAQKTLQLFNELLGVPKIQLTEHQYTIVNNSICRMGDEYFSHTDDYAASIIRSELHILITQLYRIKSKSHQINTNKKYLPQFITFQELVETHVINTNKVTDYAQMMAISTKTLNAISQGIINKTAKEFIDEIGIKQIKRLLINTPLSIKEVAHASGFHETTNFYKYFKRHVGTTPERFRTTF